jgi:hypothetical protein
MATSYVYIDSTRTDQYPNNTGATFTVPLLKSEQYTGTWYVGLAGITIGGKQVSQKDLYISCDLVIPSFVLNTYIRILRRVTLKKSGLNTDFSPVQYFALDTGHNINSITIKLLDATTLDTALLQDCTVTCALHFTKTWGM